MENHTSSVEVPQLPALQRLVADPNRIDIERLSDRLLLRLRPASVPPGLTFGPRVSLEFTAAHARMLGEAMMAHASIMENSHG